MIGSTSAAMKASCRSGKTTELVRYIQESISNYIR
jgi:hypothetical protein